MSQCVAVVGSLDHSYDCMTPPLVPTAQCSPPRTCRAVCALCAYSRCTPVHCHVLLLQKETHTHLNHNTVSLCTHTLHTTAAPDYKLRFCEFKEGAGMQWEMKVGVGGCQQAGRMCGAN